MTAYYNEIDPYAAQWLRNLIQAGQIAPGDVDERSIVDVRADDLRGYAQCHFFAGIGGWSIALRLAGWPDDRPVWTGSCPCQPFSAAGAGKAADDERHLWPAWFPLIQELRPAIVFGEQVEAAVGWGWLDAVFSDLEAEGYACGTTVLPACGVGAPHIRQRLWFVADTDGRDTSAEGLQRSGQHGQREKDDGACILAESQRDGCEGREQRELLSQEEWQHQSACGPSTVGGLAITSSAERRAGRSGRPGAGEAGPHAQSARSGDDGALDYASDAPHDDAGQHERGSSPLAARSIEPSPVGGFWQDAEWIACTDGKARPVGPGSFPLGHGIQRRASKLRAYGNAIVPQVAAEFIAASDNSG